MKKTLILLTAMILLVPGLVFSDLVTFKVGYFLPHGAKYDLSNPRPNDLWWIEFDQMTFTPSMYQSTNFGFSYEYFFSNQLSLILGVEGYSKSKLGQYLDYVGIEFTDGDFAFPDDFQADFFPSHTFSVTITPFQLSLKIAPFGRRMKVIPYIGGGVGLYLWSVRLFGDLIDFEDDSYYYEDEDIIVDPIYPIYGVDAREENKLKFGYQAFGGVMIPLANRLSLEAEFKYNNAKADFTEAFEGFDRFDLGGYQISVGLNYWF
jgi:opacity protein-like surface antigen